MGSLFTRGAGLLAHPTSLPGPHGVGDLGGTARLLDWMAEAGLKLWQILPLVPPAACESPYSSAAALATNPLLIDLGGLVERGLLERREVQPPSGFPQDRVDFDAAHGFKEPLLRLAAERLAASPTPDFARFADAAGWADDAALFMALDRRHEGRPWHEWEPAMRDRDPAALDTVRGDAGPFKALMFLFQEQWQSVRDAAARRGIRIIGDLPIYVDQNSADVWANRECFQLDGAGLPTQLAGVPPDYFAEDGQLWGNPLYDWERLAADGHAWWVARMRRLLEQVDVFRLDHFRGFAAYWSVPSGSPDARGGEWVRGPGRALFDDVAAALGELPIIAEDLGVIDDDVHALRDALGLPGMRVLQFAFGERSDHPFLPHNHVEECVVYTGTHDNDTTRGWFEAAAPHIRSHVQRYFGISGSDVAWDLIREALRSPAVAAILPLQDLLSLGSGARMNTPGVARGNWSWRVRADAFNPDVAARLRGLIDLYSR